MQNEEITESLRNGTDEDLQEDLKYANWRINKKPTFPNQVNTARFLARKQEYREYRDLILAEIASRA